MDHPQGGGHDRARRRGADRQLARQPLRAEHGFLAPPDHGDQGRPAAHGRRREAGRLADEVPRPPRDRRSRPLEKADRPRLDAFNATGQNATARDDTDKAKAHAEALRLAQEFPPIAGSFTVPWISHAVGVGDLISEISGRDVSLIANAGTPAGEGPRYPSVVGVSWDCQRQSTTFRLSDRRSEPEDANHGYGPPAENSGDESRTLRERVAALESLLDRLETEPVAGSPARAVHTVDLGAYPTTTGYLTTFAVTADDVSGTEAEGAAGSLASQPGTFFAVNLGPGLPPVGTEAVADEVGGSWVFYYA